MRFTIITVLLFLAFVAGAQNNNTIDINYKKLDIPPLTSDCFFFSSNNILWFSTARGLTSFDGTEIHSYYPDTSAINNYYFSGITAITEDSSKNLWIATRKIALIYFNTSSKKCITVSLGNEKSELHLDNITRLFLDKNGFLWVSTTGCGFYIYNTRSGSVEHYNFSDKPIDCNKFPSGFTGIGPKNCMSPHLKDPDKMWLGSVDGIFLFDRKTKQLFKKFEFKGSAKIHGWYTLNISYLDMIDDSTLCVGTSYYGMGLYNINNNSLKMFSPYPSSQTKIYPYPTIQGSDVLQVAYVSKKSSDEYLVSICDSLPIIFNSRTKTYTYLHNHEFFKKTQDIFCPIIGIGRNADLWFEKDNRLYVISNDFSLFDVKTTPSIYGATDDAEIGLSDIIWDEEQRSYFIAYRYLDQIYQLDSNLSLIRIIPTSFPPQTTYRNIKLITDREKRIWALRTSAYLLKDYSTIYSTSVLLKGAENFIPPQQLSPKLKALQELEGIAVDNDGNILFSRRNGDILIFNSLTSELDSVKIPQESSKIKGANCRLHYDTNLNCVYTSNGTKVVQYDLRTKVMRFFKPEDLTPPDRSEWSICSFDSEGNIWALRRSVQDNELRLYDPRTFQLMKTFEFKNYKGEKMNIVSLEWGPNHSILCSTSDGLMIYNYKNDMFELIDKENGLLAELQERKIRFANNKVFWGNGWKIQYAPFTKLFSLTHDRIALINTIKIFGKKVSYIEPFNNTVELDYKRNNLGISFSSIEYLFPERIQYAFRLSAIDNEWRITDHKSREIIYSNLPPGKYIFELKAQVLGGNWQQDPLKLYITITPPFWQTWWFRTIAAISIIGLLYWLFRIRIASVRKKEQVNAKHEKELLELEAKALRAQMNPHFIFNCMNSIKALIQNDEKQRSIEYLTTFSKLIRTLFQNSDKRQISLFDEIETCRLYTQLEAMRLNGKLKYSFDIDPNLDLRSVMVPALIIQPFVENAIWHGIVPKDEGTIKVTVKGNDTAVICEVDDNGIGREMSKLNKPATPVIHESKGVHLSQVRLDLEKMLNETQATIETFDKYDNDKSTGTKVVLNFNLN